MPFSLTGDGRSLSSFFNFQEQNNENLLIEKANLLCVFKLVIKDLLNSSLRHERLLEKEFFPLKHFLIVFEQILFHGFTGRKSFTIGSSSNRKDLWPLIELIEKNSNDHELSEISRSSKEMTNLKTNLGRVRAWLRLALMQKRLADYFKILIEQKKDLKELYEIDSLLLSDEISIISGLLTGLNVLDLNFCLKEASLDFPIETSIFYSFYLRERRIPIEKFRRNFYSSIENDDQIDELDDYSSISSSPTTRSTLNNGEPILVINTEENSSLDDQRITNIVDQKNYVEELYRNLQKNFKSVQTRLQQIEEKNKIFIQDEIVKKFRIEQLEDELKKIKTEKDQIEFFHQKKIETLNGDMALERETFQKSRHAFDSMYKELQKKYEEEIQSKQDVENEFQLQLAQKNDFIEATKFMEKDVEVKTTLYNSMKQQIDEIKRENIRLSERFKIEKDRNQEIENQIQNFEKENFMLRETIGQLEKNIEEINREKHALDDTNLCLSRDLAKIDAEKTLIENEVRIEKENRQRLEESLKKEKDKVSSLQFEIHDFKIVTEEFQRYKSETTREQNDLRKKFQEQEETIREMSLKLEISIKREDEFREKDGLRTSTWMKDEDVKDCCQCKKEFSSLRRKHHCRNCGQIFCESCAGTKLQLASSNKPVRVCDLCRNRLLAQCAVNSC